MKISACIIALLASLQATNALPSTGSTPLRVEAAKKDILIRSGAINPSYLEDPQFGAVLAQQFNSLSPENEIKWIFIHPTKDTYNWSSIDQLVVFAEEHDIVLKGHGLISTCCNPKYLQNITDPTEFRAAMTDHFNAVMHWYNGKADSGLQSNLFLDVLGPGYIADVFCIARVADQDTRLFINKNLVKSFPGKRQELYDLFSGLVADGVPINGVTLQMHITKAALVPGVIMEMVNSYNVLGLETMIAEMDVHTLNTTLQTQIYRDVINEALQAGITDISFWGFMDKHLYTWVPGVKAIDF